ncbi:Bifunctional purine biosynthesis protein PurH [Cryptotrichosporon argae]
MTPLQYTIHAVHFVVDPAGCFAVKVAAPSSQTRSAIFAVLWACAYVPFPLYARPSDRSASYQHGFHISALNFPVRSLECSAAHVYSSTPLPPCLGIDDATYGAVTALFSVGGLVGSVLGGWVTHEVGAKGGLQTAAWAGLAGGIIMATAPMWEVLAFGRFLAGVGAGTAAALVPPFLAALARAAPALAARSGQVGAMHQLAIVLGICTAQVAGLVLTGEKGDKPGKWRSILAIPTAVAFVQIITAWYVRGDKRNKAEADAETAAPLLAPAQAQLSIRELVSTPALRAPVALVCAVLVGQQLSGVNAVMFYSTPVLAPLLPTGAGIVAIGVTVVNALMSVPAILLVDRVGRRTLFLVSAALMGAMSLLLAFGLNYHLRVLSAFAIVAFIASFALGLGPVPWLIISELVPPHAVPALSALALALSWLANFVVAVGFLPLRDAMSTMQSDGTRDGEGNIFFIFTGVLAVLGAVAFRGLRT